MNDKLVDRKCVLLDGHCNCECPESDCRHSLSQLCTKRMTPDTCPYNPILGCDCGLNPPDPPREKIKFPASAFLRGAQDKEFKDQF